MSADPRPPTAKIYQFPRRVSASAGKPEASTRPTVEIPPPSGTAVDFESGWYHEAAIEAERLRKH
jgi:hypothetical protein